jgi:hypothetical protein
VSTITLPRAVIEQVREAFKELDYASEPDVNEIARAALAALDAALAQPDATREQYPEKGPALAVYNEIAATDDPGSPLERLRFFCSLAMRPQDWLDVAPFFDALAEPEPITVAKTERKPRITCGFVDVQFDGEGWFCAKCNERMPANYEELVKRDSGERHYLELMQRKAERFHGIAKEDKP